MLIILTKMLSKRQHSIKNNRLSERYNCNVYFKREDLQVVRSFKVRGAYNKIAKLSQDDKNKGIVCASAGNHAQGVAYSAAKLNIKADIFVPENTPLQKIKSVRKFSDDNCTLHITGKNFDECLNKARNMADDNGNVFIHPFDDKDVVDGQGTICC